MNVPRPTSVTPRIPKRPCRFKVSDIVRNSVLIFVALVMLILAFCPIINAKVNYHEYELTVRMSAVDQITLLFDSMMEINDEKLQQTKIYKEYLELADDLDSYLIFVPSHDYKPLSVVGKDLSKLGLLFMRLNARHEYFNTPAVYYVAAIASVVYIVNAVALLVLSILNLITAFKAIKDEKRRIFKWTVRTLTLTPTLLLLAFSSISIAVCNGAAPAMTVSSVNTLIFSFTAIIAFFVLRLVFDKDTRRDHVVPKIIATALSIVVICLSFSPVFSSSVRTVFANSSDTTTATVNMNASFFTAYQVDEKTEAEFEHQLNNMTKIDKEEHFSNVFHRFDELDEQKMSSVLGTDMNSDLLVNLFGCKFEDYVLDLVSLIGILFIGALGGAAVVLWQNASYFASGEYSEKAVVIGKIVSAACAAAALGVSIVCFIATKDFIATYMPDNYSLSLKAGVICFAIFAIGAVFCPHKVAPRVKKNDEIVENELT